MKSELCGSLICLQKAVGEYCRAAEQRSANARWCIYEGDRLWRGCTFWVVDTLSGKVGKK